MAISMDFFAMTGPCRRARPHGGGEGLLHNLEIRDGLLDAVLNPVIIYRLETIDAVRLDAPAVGFQSTSAQISASSRALHTHKCILDEGDDQIQDTMSFWFAIVCSS
jgi:hypothetical protein